MVNNNAAALLLILSTLASRPGGHRLAQPAHRDRRFVPAARCDGRFRLPPRRGRLHQPDPSRRLRDAPSVTTPPPSSWPTSPTSGSSASPPSPTTADLAETGPPPRSALDRRSGIRLSARPPSLGSAGRADGRRTARRWRRPRLFLGRQAPRRTPGRDHRRPPRVGRAPRPPPALPGAETGQDRTDPHGPGARRPRRRAARGDPALRHDVGPGRQPHRTRPPHRRQTAQARHPGPRLPRCEPLSAAARPPRRPCPATVWPSAAGRRFRICCARATHR